MAQLRRIVVTVPQDLPREMEELLALEPSQRNAFILEAVRRYVAERKKRDMREQMRRGYQTMARINLALAEEGPVFESGPARRGRSRGDE